jgi:hypothetical protein
MSLPFEDSLPDPDVPLVLTHYLYRFSLLLSKSIEKLEQMIIYPSSLLKLSLLDLSYSFVSLRKEERCE